MGTETDCQSPCAASERTTVHERVIHRFRYTRDCEVQDRSGLPHRRGERKSGAESRGEILAQAPTGKSPEESKGNPNPGLYYEARGNAFTSERHAPQGQHVRGGCTRSTASAVAACHVVVSESWPAPAPPVDALGAPESMSRRRARALAQSGLISTHIARHRWSQVVVVE